MLASFTRALFASALCASLLTACGGAEVENAASGDEAAASSSTGQGGSGAAGGGGATVGVGGAGGGAEPDPEWDAFAAQRLSFLEALGEPILACITGPGDTSHPAFHGCIDWHSAVHATYALLVIYRLTGKSAYLDAADAVLQPAALAAELQMLKQGATDNELPYGFAWFLALARERKKSTGGADSEPLAAEVADGLQAWLANRSPAQLAAGALANDYDSISWAVLNLWERGVSEGDAARIAFAQTLALQHLLPLDAQCPLEDDEQNVDDFFPPCLHRARAILSVLPEDQRPGWLEDFVPETLGLTPIGAPATSHSAGLNFSRSWGLWSIYRATALVPYRDLYIQHIEKHMAQPEYWAARYNKYSHWVAQFGVYGIALSFEP